MKKLIMTTVIGIFMSNCVFGNLSQKQKKDTLPELLDSISRILKTYNVPGAGIALVHKDSMIWVGGLGLADVASNRRVDQHSVFRVGSITKSFVALGILRLVDEGKLRLDDKLVDLAPEIRFENPWRKTDPLRLFHLLEHTAGFDDMHFNEMISLEGETLSAEEALAVNPNARKARWRPGTRASYSNPGYAMAGFILEKYSGERFEDYLKTILLEPLKMDDSSFETIDLTPGALVEGYKVERNKLVVESVPNILFRWAGSLNASTLDLAKFTQFFLNDGSSDMVQLWNEEQINRMETVSSTLAAKAGLNLGYGLASMSTVKGGLRQNGHSGGINGFISRYRYIREADVGYVVLLNSVNGKAHIQISNLIRNFLTPNSEDQKSIGTKEKLDYSEIVGSYKNANPRNEVFSGVNSLFSLVKIFAEGDTLFSKGFMQDRKVLIHMGANRFRYPDHTEEHLLFVKNQNGKMVFIDADGLGEYYESTSIIGHQILFVTSLIAFGLLLTYIPVWLIRRVVYWIKKRQYPQEYVNEIMMLLSPVFLILVIMGISSVDLSDVMILGEVNVKTVTFFLITLGLAIFMILGAVLTIKHFNTKKGFWKYYLTALALANVQLLVLLYQWNLIGLRTWAW